MDSHARDMVALLRRDGRLAYADLARLLGTTRASVAARITPMIESGELRIIAAVHPDALGLHVKANLQVMVDGSVASVVEMMRPEPAVVFLAEVVGQHQLTVEIHAESLSHLQEVIRQISETPGVARIHFVLYDRVYRSFFQRTRPLPLGRSLDGFDRALFAALYRDGRASYGTLARSTGLSITGVRARLQKLIDTGILQIGAVTERTSEFGSLMFGLGVTIRTGYDLDEVVSKVMAIEDVEYLVETIGRFDLMATVTMASIAGRDEVVASLKAIEAVIDVESWLTTRVWREAYRRPVWPVASVPEADLLVD